MLFFSIFYQIKLDEYTKIVYNIIVVGGRSSRKEECEKEDNMDAGIAMIVVAVIESITTIFGPIIQKQIKKLLKEQKKKPSKRKTKSLKSN